MDWGKALKIWGFNHAKPTFDTHSSVYPLLRIKLFWGHCKPLNFPLEDDSQLFPGLIKTNFFFSCEVGILPGPRTLGLIGLKCYFRAQFIFHFNINSGDLVIPPPPFINVNFFHGFKWNDYTMYEHEVSHKTTRCVDNIS